MSNEEAIRILNYFKENPTIQNDEVIGKGKDLFDKAVKALEKQIPKKPIYINYDGKDGNNRCVCPNCGKLVFAMGNGDILYGHMADYCEWCGQSLEWEECRGKAEGLCDVCMEKRCEDD